MTKICTTENEAYNWVKENRNYIKGKFANTEVYPPVKNPYTIFMAGAPGVGKTEWSKSYIEELYKIDPNNPIVRIDTDEIREMIPGYIGTNADVFQKAAGLGVTYVFDHSQKNSQNICVDTTFSATEIAMKNVKRAIDKERKTGIFYLYLDPATAWDYTKKREAVEKRFVPKEYFVETFFKSRENVNSIKRFFGDKIELHLIVFNSDHKIVVSEFNITNVDPYIKISYTEKQLLKELL